MEHVNTDGSKVSWLRALCRIDSFSFMLVVELIQRNGQPLKEGDELELEFFEQRPE